jgi:hypothetical protein
MMSNFILATHQGYGRKDINDDRELYLPQAFRDKFAVGRYKIRGNSPFSLCTKSCSILSQREYEKFMDAATSENDDKLLQFFRDFTRNGKDIVYLFVYEGIHIGSVVLYPELFRKLIITRNGRIITNMNCAWHRVFFIPYMDDHNIQQELCDESSLIIRGLIDKKTEFFIYHKGRERSVLTSLYLKNPPPPQIPTSSSPVPPWIPTSSSSVPPQIPTSSSSVPPQIPTSSSSVPPQISIW